MLFLYRLLRDWPNTYAMTKAIAEGEILTYGKGLPIGVIRPSMSEYKIEITKYKYVESVYRAVVQPV